MSQSFKNYKIEYLYCLFKGEPGTRKSTAALSFPKPIYYLSWDQKMDALVLPINAWGLNREDIHWDDFVDWNAGKKALEGLQVKCPYKTIVIDSITSCADAINKQTLKLKTGGNDEVGKRIAGIPVNSIEDFNAEESALKELVTMTKDIAKYHKVNIILIAHIIQKEQKTANGKTHMSRILLTAGKGIAQKIPAYCSEVYHFNIKEELQGGGKYTCLTTHTGDDFARSSLPVPNEIQFGDEPLYDKWIAPAILKINGGPNATSNVTTLPQTTQQPKPTSKFGA